MASVTIEVKDDIAAVTIDDGKVNALSPGLLEELNSALDSAESQRSLIISGRSGIFSAGFSLPVLQGGGPEAARMLAAGFETSRRLLRFPIPVIIACTGHAIAMGSFLLLSGDYRIGVAGPYKIMANEVAIGLTMPYAAVEICRQRLSPAHFHRAVALSESYAPEEAVDAGFLDRVVAAEQLDAATQETAARLATLDRAAHSETKRRARAGALRAIEEGLEADGASVGR
jgi:enoyl-CoA hydratase